MTNFRSWILLAAAAGSLGVAGCGGSDSASGGSPDARKLLTDTFSPSGGDSKIQSGTIELKLSGQMAGSTAGNGTADVKLALNKAKSAGTLPDFKVDVNASGKSGAQSLDVTAGATYTGDRFYVNYKGEDYDVGEQLSAQVKEAAEQSIKQSASASKGTDITAKLGLNPGTWLTAPKVEGTEKIGDDDTYKITGAADVKALVPDVLGAAKEAQSLAGSAAAGQQVPDVSSAQLDSVTKKIKQLDVTVWTGKDDHILRQLKIELSLDGKASGDNLTGTIQLTITGVNQDQPIDAPSSTKPLTDLMPQLGGLAGGLSGLTGGGATGGMSSGGAAGSSSSSAAAAAAYAACVSAAGTDTAKLNACEQAVTR